MLALPLRNRRGEVVATAVVDDDRTDLVAQRWYLDGSYVVTSPRRGVKVALHRVVLGLQPGDGLEGDHENGNPLDCRRSNLRIATRAQNGQNVPVKPGSASRYRGVFYSRDPRRRSRWRARPTLAGKRFHLGYFATEDEAGAVVMAWYAEHMPFAVLERCRV